MKSFNVPMLVTGGGGYTKSNVARCWALETAVLTDTPISDDLPNCAYYEYFSPEYKLHTLTEASYRDVIENVNTLAYVDNIKREVLQNLSHLDAAPSVQMHYVPPDSILPEYEDDEDDNPDIRLCQYAKDHMIIKEEQPFDAGGRYPSRGGARIGTG